MWWLAFAAKKKQAGRKGGRQGGKEGPRVPLHSMGEGRLPCAGVVPLRSVRPVRGHAGRSGVDVDHR
jgi:hypothetical protein